MRKFFVIATLSICTIVLLNAEIHHLTDGRIVFGGDIDFPPYEFLDETGEPAGFIVEFTRVLAEELGLDYEIRLFQRKALPEKLVNGEIDVIMGMPFSLEGIEKFHFSHAHNHLHMSIITRKDDRRIVTERDIYGKEVILLKGMTLPSLTPYLEYSYRLIYANTPIEALSLLADGFHDLAILDMRLSYYNMVRTNLENRLSILFHCPLSIEYCYASLTENRGLIRLLNQGMQNAVRDGSYLELHDKWLFPYTLSKTDSAVYRDYFFKVLIPLGFLLILIFFSIWFLQRKHVRKEEKMAEELEEHKRITGELTESRNRYQSLLENLSETVIENDESGRIVFANNYFYSYFGYSKEELDKGIYFKDLFALNQQDDLADFLTTVVRKEERVVGDFTATRRDGSSFPAKIYANSIKSSDGKESISVIILDLSKQLRTESTQKALYRISEAVHETHDIDELFSTIHKTVSELMLADNFHIVLHDEKSDDLKYRFRVKKNNSESLSMNSTVVELNKLVYKSGKSLLAKEQKIRELYRDSETSVTGELPKVWLGIPLKTENKLLGVIGVQDYEQEDTYDDQDMQVLTFISEQIAIAIESKQQEEQLKTTLAHLEQKVKERTATLSRSEKLFRTLAENSENIVMLFDRSLKHLYCNPIIEKYTKAENYPGLKASDFIGKTHRELGLPEDLVNLWESTLTEIFETGNSSRIDFQLPSGTWIDWHLVPDKNEKGEVRYVITNAHDMTTLKLREEEIKKLNIELEERIERRTKELEEEVKNRKQAEDIQRTLFLISEAVSTTSDLEALYTKIHEAIRVLVPADNICIALYDEEEDILSFPYNYDEVDPAPTPHKPGRGLTEYVLRTGQPLLARQSDIHELNAKGEVELIGSLSQVWLGIPLKLKDKVTGVIMVQDYHKADTYNEDHKKLLTFVSEQITHAIERKEADHQNNLQRIYFEQLFDSNPAGIVMIDNEDHILACNSSFTKLFGYQQEEIIGKTINQTIVPQQLLEEATHLSSSTQKGDIVEKETVRVTKEGREVFVKVLGVPITVEGKRVGLYGIYLNLTELHDALNSLYEEKEKLSTMLASIGDGVIATDTKSKILLMNKNAEDLTGWKQTDAEGLELERVFRVINGSNNKSGKNVVISVLKNGEVIHMTNNTVLLSKDGSEHVIESSAAPIKDRKRELIGVILVFRDITEKKTIEEELQKSAKLESIGILAGGIAHDFNNILTAVLGSISLARQIISGELPEVDAKLNEAEKASVRAIDLTQQLLTFSRGGEPIRKTSSIKDTISEAASFATHGSNAECLLEIADDLRAVEADIGQISQVINNLVINAVQAMPNGGSVKIKGENVVIEQSLAHKMNPGNYIKITIEDNGIGIPRSQLSKIFDPFYTTKKSGSGLGLSSSYTIIKRHDGYLSVDSTVGVGTTFTIFLPASDKKVQIAQEDEAQDYTGQGEILLMDDDKVLVEIVTEMLASLGYRVTSAYEGKEAIALYKEKRESGKPFDLVILDLTIPGGMGGKETIKEILAYDGDAVCLVSSGYSSDPIMSQYELYGFKEVLSKPYSLKQLGRTLKRVLDKTVTA